MKNLGALGPAGWQLRRAEIILPGFLGRQRKARPVDCGVMKILLL